MNEVARLLREQPQIVATLLARHVPDERGRCRGCTSGGTGTPQARWPCSLHFYATAAREPTA